MNRNMLILLVIMSLLLTSCNAGNEPADILTMVQSAIAVNETNEALVYFDNQELFNETEAAGLTEWLATAAFITDQQYTGSGKKLIWNKNEFITLHFTHAENSDWVLADICHPNLTVIRFIHSFSGNNNNDALECIVKNQRDSFSAAILLMGGLESLPVLYDVTFTETIIHKDSAMVHVHSKQGNDMFRLNFEHGQWLINFQES